MGAAVKSMAFKFMATGHRGTWSMNHRDAFSHIQNEGNSIGQTMQFHQQIETKKQKKREEESID